MTFSNLLKGLCNAYNYADDNSLSHSDSDIDVIKTKLEYISEKAISWFDNNCMQANPEKFQLGFFTKSDKKLSLQIGNITLESQDTVKLLGINFDKKLNFYYHASTLCKKSGYQLNILSRLSHVLDRNSKFRIYNAYLLSTFFYCPLVWHFCGKTMTKKIEKIQERTLRLIFQDYDMSYSDLLSVSGRTSLYVLRMKCLLIEVYKILNGMSPLLKDLCTTKVLDYGLRKSGQLELHNYKSITYGQNSLRYLGPKLWNQLENEMKNIEQLDKFRNSIHKSNIIECSCNSCILCDIVNL